MAIVYYVTNYAIKIEDPVWKRAAVAAELPIVSGEEASAAGSENKARHFLAKVANRILRRKPYRK